MKTKIFSSIDQIPQATWNALLPGHSHAFSHEFWEIIEQSGMNDFSYRHVLFLADDETPVALTSFYSVTTDIAIFAPLPLRNLLATIRRFFPNFLKLRMLEWGTPITVSSPPFITGPGTSPAEIVRHMHAILHATAKAEGQWLIIVRDFEANTEDLQHEFTRLGYHLVDSLPNTYLDITWASVAEYRAAMKSYYRSKLVKHLRRNEEQHVRHELVDDFDHLADQLCTQWMVVHNQADEFQREVLTPTFYREFSQRMGTRSKALLFYRNDQLVGHALLLHDDSLLRWLYFGRNEASNDSLYLYVAHAVIQTAIELQAKRLEMGLPPYAIKQDLGAMPGPIKLAIRGRSRLFNRLVGWGYGLLNNPPALAEKNISNRDKD